jgi:hypothetical protein
MKNNGNRKIKVRVYWNGGSIQVPLAGEKEEYSGYRMDEVVFYEEAALALVGLIFFAEDEEILKEIGL